jgi:hypothetical protein
LRFLSGVKKQLVGSLAMAAALFVAPHSLSAASLERVGEDGVVLTLFGERLHFRVRDAERVVVLIPAYTYAPDRKEDPLCQAPSRQSQFERSATLKEWLEGEDLGKCLLSAFTRVENRDPTVRGGNAQLGVSFGSDNGLISPGGVPKGLLEGDDKPIEGRLWVYVVIGDGPAAGVITLDSIPSEARDGPFPWRVYRDPRPYNFKKTGEFFLAPQFRKGSARSFFEVVCGYDGYEGRGERACEGDYHSGPVLYRYSWKDGRDDQGREISPRDAWIGYDEALRKIADSIFADRPSGFLQ